MLSRRTFGSLMGATACIGGAAAGPASATTLDLDAIPLAAHEAAMRLTITAAKANPFYPFGAVIIGAADHAVLAQGVNNSKTNPTLHGEIVAINDYVARHGNQGWADGILYTTGEPCPMCMSAISVSDVDRLPVLVVDEPEPVNGLDHLSLENVDDAAELGEKAVTGRLDQPAVMLGDLRIENLGLYIFEGLESSSL